MIKIPQMPWVILALAGLFEIGWAVSLKYSAGFTHLGPSIVAAVTMLVSIALLGVAMLQLPLGTAYAVWTGIGAVGTVILGILLFGESASLTRLFCVALIIGGIAGLKLITPEG